MGNKFVRSVRVRDISLYLIPYHRDRKKKKEEMPIEKCNLIHFSKILVNDSTHHAIQNDIGGYSNCRSGGITESLLSQHFNGSLTLATYSLSDQKTAKWLLIDYDIAGHDSAHIIDWGQARQIVRDIINKLLNIGIPQEALLVCSTGGRGVHIYVLFRKPISHELTLSFRKIVMETISSLSVEIYPDGRDIGSTPQLVRLPGYHRKYKKMSCWWNRETCCEDIDCALWELEKLNIERLSEPEIKEIVSRAEINGCINGAEAILRHCRAFQCIKKTIETEHHINHRTRVHITQVLLKLPDGAEIIHDFFKNLSDYEFFTTQKHIESLASYQPATCKSFSAQRWCDGHCTEINRLNSTTPLSFVYMSQNKIVEKWRGVIHLLEGDNPPYQYMGPRDWQVYERLTYYMNIETRKAFPSIETLATDLKCSRHSIMRALLTLESLNLIRKEQSITQQQRYKFNIYTLPPHQSIDVIVPTLLHSQKTAIKSTAIPCSKIALVEGVCSKVELDIYKNKKVANET